MKIKGQCGHSLVSPFVLDAAPFHMPRLDKRVITRGVMSIPLSTYMKFLYSACKRSFSWLEEHAQLELSRNGLALFLT